MACSSTKASFHFAPICSLMSPGCIAIFKMSSCRSCAATENGTTRDKPLSSSLYRFFGFCDLNDDFSQGSKKTRAQVKPSSMPFRTAIFCLANSSTFSTSCRPGPRPPGILRRRLRRGFASGEGHGLSAIVVVGRILEHFPLEKRFSPTARDRQSKAGHGCSEKKQ